VATVPETRYAKSGDVHIAYQVWGDGPLNLVFLPGWISHVELMWEEAATARFFERLGSFATVAFFDKRGTGLSDPVPLIELPTLEQRVDDARAVMDAAGMERAALLGVSEGGAMGVLFAATYPTRTTALILYGCWAKMTRAPDYPWGLPPPAAERALAQIEEGWSRGDALDVLAPTVAGDAAFKQRWARFQRMSASVGAAVAIMRMNFQTDVRSALPLVSAPTLIIQRSGDHMVRPEHGRYLADHIPDAKYLELPGEDHIFFLGDNESVLGEIEEFLTGDRATTEPERALATVLFTDVVGSTKRAAELGDQQWRDLLERHDNLVARHLERHRGRLVKSTGDGVLATFDGPARAIRYATALRDALRSLDIDIRAGLHTGEVELRGDDLAGIAVHITARVEALAEPGEVLVSRTVVDLVAGSGIEFLDRGEHELKGVPGSWRLFAVMT
jgi:class 3 adenylate cyclase/pimeloyl-ACP methyl ester carboxylesterase